LSRAEIYEEFNKWLDAWNKHDLEGVMEFMHEEVTFNSWNGSSIRGKVALKKSWQRWFNNHGNFKFILEDFFIDEIEQKMMFSWELDWPSPEKNYLGKREKRKGVDIFCLKDGKIYIKNTYSKTALKIDSVKVSMYAL
jgi:hypothetical protein